MNRPDGVVQGVETQVSGRLLKILRLRSEHHVPMEDPVAFLAAARRAGLRADLLSFVQRIDERHPRYGYHHEPEELAVLHLTTYDDWFTHTLHNKPRNMLRKAQKSAVDVRLEEFSPQLMQGIKAIYDETPVRQGRRNRHYHKDIETITREHGTFLDRSQFIAAYHSGEVIGFVKVTYSQGCGVIMNFLSKVAHRDKAVNNALLAKTVEVCAGRAVHHLVYGRWGAGGTRGLDEFKAAHGFERVSIPRYFVPLTPLGHLALKAGVHRGVVPLVPRSCVEVAARVRAWWNTTRLHART